MGHGVLQASGGGVLSGLPTADVDEKAGTVGRYSKRGVLMRGWEIKPIGVLVLLGLLLLLGYIAYRLIYQSREAGPPGTQP